MTTALLPDAFNPPLSGADLVRLETATRGLDAHALLWASGYLAGLAARAPQAPAAQPAAVADPLYVLYGSQTGNGKRLAERVEQLCRAASVPVRLQSMGQFKPRQIKDVRTALFIVSTHGDGDPPEDALALHRHLNGAQAQPLKDLRYAVLALGDSSYPQFCRTGRDFDERLSTLGAERVLARVECDVDLAAADEAWLQSTVNAFAALVPASAPAAPGSTAPEIHTASGPVRQRASLLLNQRLTGRHSGKDVRHLEFALDSGRFDYLPGDSVSLRAPNAPAVVAEVLALGGWSGNEQVSVGGRELTLAAALRDELELTQLARPVVLALAALGTARAHCEWLTTCDTDAFAAYVAGRQVADVLRETGATPDAASFVALLKPLARRSYSISSSRLATPDEVHLTVAMVDGEHAGQPRTGCASGYLAGLGNGAELELQLERNTAFRLPADDATPILMIGPGTGIAPFRAFIEERAARGATGESWLFFGERTQREDFLYQIEWQRHLREGSLTRLDLAFSRDGAEKVYVQDRLRAQAAEVYRWIEQGAAIYVCGDARRMARDVHEALVELIADGRGLGREAAEDSLFELREQGRYQRDVY